MIRKTAWTAAVLVLAGAACWIGVLASDHDDGENDMKARSLNLTDLYVFREDNQTGSAGDVNNLIFIMCTNPRSVARQQYYFSTNARYEFHVSRVAGAATTTPTAADDVILRFEFGIPDANGRQPITVTALRDGQTFTAGPGNTSKLGDATTTTMNPFTLDGQNLNVFAGLRQDPFFFDVEQFFKVRAGAAAGFRAPAQAVDFTAGYNVNAIVVRVPIAFLQGTTAATGFDVWETISIRN